VTEDGNEVDEQEVEQARRIGWDSAGVDLSSVLSVAEREEVEGGEAKGCVNGVKMAAMASNGISEAVAVARGGAGAKGSRGSGLGVMAAERGRVDNNKSPAVPASISDYQFPDSPSQQWPRPSDPPAPLLTDALSKRKQLGQGLRSPLPPAAPAGPSFPTTSAQPPSPADTSSSGLSLLEELDAYLDAKEQQTTSRLQRRQADSKPS